MTKEELKEWFKDRHMEEALELLEEAETGELNELEIVPSIGLLQEKEFNDEFIRILKEEQVKIRYITDEDI